MGKGEIARYSVFKRLVLQTRKHQGLFWERDIASLSLSKYFSGKYYSRIENVCTGLRYPDPEDRIFNRVISGIFVVLRETTITQRRSFCDELCQLYDVIYKTRCPTLFHTEHHQPSFIGNFHIFLPPENKSKD